MAFLEPKVSAPRGVEDYKASIFSIGTKQVHAIDQIDLHKHVSEMIYSTLTSSAMVSLNNMHSQLKIERMSSLTKDTRIKTLEYLVIKLEYDPSDVKVAKELIKRKNVNIQSLRKHLKHPTTENRQTKEVTSLEMEKEKLFTIVVEQNDQIQKMEQDMEALVKEKEKWEAIGTSTVRIVTHLTTQVSISDSLENLTQALGELSLTNKEVEKFTAALSKMEEDKIKVDNAYLAELQNNFKLVQQIQKYGDQTIMI